MKAIAVTASHFCVLLCIHSIIAGKIEEYTILSVDEGFPSSPTLKMSGQGLTYYHNSDNNIVD
jgi:hypothetical protein